MTEPPAGFVMEANAGTGIAAPPPLPPGFVVEPKAPHFDSPEYIKALAEKHGFDPDHAKQIRDTALSTAVLRGVPILGGLVDKATAAGNAAVHGLTGAGASGDTFAERYAKDKAFHEELATDFEKAHPTASTVAQLGGGALATLATGGTATGAKLLGMVEGSLPKQIAAGVASGSAITAADNAVRGGDPLAGAAIGGLIGGAVPPAARLVGAAVAPLVSTVRGIVNPAQEAARRVSGAVQRDVRAGTAGLDPAEIQAAQAAGQPVNVMDVGGETTRALARSAANTSPEGRQILDRAVNDRFETQSERMTDWLRSTFHYPDAEAQQAALQQVARTTNKSAYDAAHAAADTAHPSGIWSPELERLTSSPDVVDAMKSAAQRGAGRAVAEGFGGFNPGVTFDNGIMNFRKGPTGQPSYPDLRFWDYSYRNLRDSADQAFRAGRNSEGSALKSQANQLRDELDRMVPEFGRARAGAAQQFGAQDALEAGQKFVTAKMQNGQARLALAQMSPQERQLFQDGFVDRFVKQLNEVPNRRNVAGQIANSPAALERLNIAMGPQRANEFRAMLHVENIMDSARGAVQGNSTTARQLHELGLAGGYSGLALGGLAGGNPFNADPEHVLSAALLLGATRGKAAIDHRVAQQVARLLTSGNPAQVANGMRMVGSGRLLDALRHADVALARAAAPQVLPGRPPVPALPPPAMVGQNPQPQQPPAG